MLNEELGDLSLMIRPTFNTVEGEIDEVFVRDNPIGPRELIIEKLDGYGNSDVKKLALDLYEMLSRDKLEDSRAVIDQYYEKNYLSPDDDVEFTTEEFEREVADSEIFESDSIEPMPEEEEEDATKDIQVTFKEVLE